ncbi:chloride channel CLIC-like protein 1 isoform X2 [Ptychodera flava]|uniref:chloride channel CLIC-like protein 1 isoform X2 n=1 Tax=Ptychodera flava TaxID=63121 RepID=UPI00396A8224
MSAKRGGDEHLQFEYQVQLTKTNWSTLDEFIHSDSGNIYDAHHVLIDMVKRVDTSDKPISNWKIWLEDLFGTDYNTIVMTSLLGLGVLAFVLIMVSSEVMSRISWWKLITRGFFFLFVISIPWNWLHMYKALAVTVSKFVLKPLEHLGEAMGKFFNSVYKDLPVEVLSKAVLILIIVIVLVLIMLYCYNIRFPRYEDSANGNTE